MTNFVRNHVRSAKEVGSITDQSGMLLIPAGEFDMGSDSFYPEEAPVRRVSVDSFWIDRTPVTNNQFAEFVDATGYVTFAERPPDPAQYPGMLPEFAQAGSLVFDAANTMGLGACDWWHYRIGANWRMPLGSGSDIEGLGDHPVVHIAFADAEAYAHWAGKSLPTEAEWEFAARGGLDGADFAWGNELAPSGAILANYWQGQFPFQNHLLDGWERTSPVGSFPSNGYGLYDMIGNVWEWTNDWFGPPSTGQKKSGQCCIPVNPRGGSRVSSIDPSDGTNIPRKVLKGGSHLCAEDYCQRYRPAARYAQPIDTSTTHVGFRCVRRS